MIDLEQEIKDLMLEHQEQLMSHHKDKYNQNSYPVGYQCGYIDACKDILELKKDEDKVEL